MDQPSTSEIGQIILDMVPYLPNDQIGAAVMVASILEAGSTFRLGQRRAARLSNESDQIVGLIAERIKAGQPRLADVMAGADEFSRSEFLILLLSYDPSAVDLAVPLLREFVKDPAARAWILCSLVPESVESQRSAMTAMMLSDVQLIDEKSRAAQLYYLLDSVPSEFWDESFLIAKAIPYFGQSSAIHPTITSVLAKLLASAPESRRVEVEKKLWKVIKRNIDQKWNAHEISEIIIHLPAPLQKRLLDSLPSFSRESDRAVILTALAKSTSGVLLTEVVSVSSVLSPDLRANVFAALPSGRRSDFWQDLHNTARLIHDPQHQVRFLVAMAGWAPRTLKEPLLTEAMVAACRISEWHWWYQTARRLFPHLPDAVRNVLPDIARKMKDDYTKATLIGCLIETMSHDRTLDLLAIARSIGGPKEKVQALAHIIPKVGQTLQCELIRESLEAANLVDKPGDRIRSLLKIIPFLSRDEQRSKTELVFQLMRDADKEMEGRPFSLISNNGWHVQTNIETLVQAVGDELLPELFVRVKNFPESWPAFFRAASLRLPHTLHKEILDAIAEVDEQRVGSYSIAYVRGAPIVALASLLDPSLHLPAIKAIEAVPPQVWRTAAFSSLVPHLTESLRLRVLQSMLQDALGELGSSDRDGAVLDFVINLRVDERRALFAGEMFEYSATSEMELSSARAAWQQELMRVRPSDRAKLWSQLFRDITSLYEPRAGAGLNVWAQWDPESLSENREKGPETKRFADLVLYPGQLAGDQLADAEPLKDDESIVADRDYTLEVAIRLKRKGIEADLDAPRDVKNPRQDQEPLTIEIIVTSDESSFEIRNHVASIVWRYQEDSSSAVFHFKCRPSGASAWPVTVEVRFHYRLDFLDVVKLWLPVIGRTSVRQIPSPPREFGDRRLLWTDVEDCFEAVDARARDRALSIGVSRRDSTYRFRFAYRRAADKVTVLQFRRTLTESDLNALLVRVRTFWTKLAVTHYDANLSATASTFKSYVAQLAECGRDAWRLLFGNRIGDERGEPEVVGEAIANLALPEGAVIQIVYDDDAANFTFPWNILCTTTDAYAQDDPQQFWGLRYQIEQVRDGPRLDRQGDDSLDVAFVLDQGFGNSSAAIEFFERLKKKSTSNLTVSQPISLRQTLFDELSHTPPRNLYYFFCHGYAPSQSPTLRFDGWKELNHLVEAIPEGAERRAWNYYLGLDPGDGLEPWIFIGGAKIRQSELADHKFFQGERRPIVFLNMCQSADLSPTMTTGLVRLFLDRRAAAVVGTESPISSVTAHAFGSAFLENLALANDVGTALQAARQRLLGGAGRNPLALAYTLYGRATTRACRSPILLEPMRQEPPG